MNTHNRFCFVLCTSILLIAFCLCEKENSGPEILWERTYGSAGYDVAYGIEQTVDGGFIIAGVTDSLGSGNPVMYLVKIDTGGDIIWTKTYGLYYEEAFSIEKCSNGGYVLAGYTDYFGIGGDIYVVRIDEDGNSLWSQVYGGDSSELAYSIKETSDGGFIITGWTNSYGAGIYDVYLVKTNAVGDTIWTRTYGGTEDDFGTSVCETHDGGFVITGWTESSSENYDIYLIRTDAGGDTLWTKAYGGQYDDMGESVIETSENSYVITGMTRYSSGGIHIIFLLNVNADGDTIWCETYADGIGHDVKQTEDGGYIVAGKQLHDFPNYDLYLLKTDANGSMLWEKSIGGSAFDVGNSVLETTDAGFTAVGSTESYGTGMDDVYVVKIAPYIE